jgi:hypothetical protein
MGVWALDTPELTISGLKFGVSEHAYTLYIFELSARNSNMEDMRDESRILLAYTDMRRANMRGVAATLELCFAFAILCIVLSVTQFLPLAVWLSGRGCVSKAYAKLLCLVICLIRWGHPCGASVLAPLRRRGTHVRRLAYPQSGSHPL